MLLGATGSVAAIKVAELAHLLVAFAEVKIVATKAARHFIKEIELPPAARHMHGETPKLGRHECEVLCQQGRHSR